MMRVIIHCSSIIHPIYAGKILDVDEYMARDALQRASLRISSNHPRLGSLTTDELTAARADIAAGTRATP